MTDGSFDVLTVNRNNPAHLFVGGTWAGNMAVIVSWDDGASFTSRQVPAPSGYVRAVAVNPQDDSTIYIGGYYYPDGALHGALFKTTDSGSVWEDIRGTIEDAPVDAIEVDPVNPHIVMVLAGGSLYKSENAGSSWQDITPAPGLSAFRINPEVPNEIYASSGDDFLMSEDGGWSWTSIAEGFALPDVAGIDLIPSVKMVYAWTRGGGIFRNRREALYAVSIASGPRGTTNPGPGVYAYGDGATLDVTALPQTGYRFKDWSGDLSGTANPLHITVGSDIGVKAMFHLAAPSGFTVARQEARSALMVQYINVLSWQKITQVTGVAGYRIYLVNGGSLTPLGQVDASTSTYWHRGVSKTGVYQYALAAFDEDGIEGETTLPKSGRVAVMKRPAAKTRPNWERSP